MASGALGGGEKRILDVASRSMILFFSKTKNMY
jgi:hypothetical protein